MSEVESAIETILRDLERRAVIIQEAFMELRVGKPRPGGQFSDLIAKVRVRNVGLEVEWYQRQWYRGNRGERKYKARYLRYASIVRQAKDWERDEVIETRDRLHELKETHKELRQILARLTTRGLLADETDLRAGFVPVQLPSQRSGRRKKRQGSGESEGND